MCDDLLEFGDDPDEQEVNTVTEYRSLLLKNSPQILKRALSSNPDESNSVLCTLLRELGKLKPEDDAIDLPPELQQKIDNEPHVGQTMREIVFAYLKGDVGRAAARESLEQLAILFEVCELTSLMQELDRIKNSGSMMT